MAAVCPSEPETCMLLRQLAQPAQAQPGHSSGTLPGRMLQSSLCAWQGMLRLDCFMPSSCRPQLSSVAALQANRSLLRTLDVFREAVLLVDTARADWRILYGNEAWAVATGGLGRAAHALPAWSRNRGCRAFGSLEAGCALLREHPSRCISMAGYSHCLPSRAAAYARVCRDADAGAGGRVLLGAVQPAGGRPRAGPGARGRGRQGAPQCAAARAARQRAPAAALHVCPAWPGLACDAAPNSKCSPAWGAWAACTGAWAHVRGHPGLTRLALPSHPCQTARFPVGRESADAAGDHACSLGSRRYHRLQRPQSASGQRVPLRDRSLRPDRSVPCLRSPAATGNIVNTRPAYPGAPDVAVGVPTNVPADGQSATTLFFASILPDAGPVSSCLRVLGPRPAPSLPP